MTQCLTRPNTYMTALFRAGLLIFQVHTSGTSFDKEFGQLHDGRQTTVTRVTVGHNGTQVVYGRTRILSLQESLAAFHVLTTIMEELGANELVYLVGHRLRGVIGCWEQKILSGQFCGKAWSFYFVRPHVPKSGPGSLVVLAVLEDCQPET